MTGIEWVIAIAAALIIGVSKTSVAGFASIPVALLAMLFPAKESTALVLTLFLVGDILALKTYFHDCQWGMLKKLLPAVIPGVVIGAVFMYFVDDNTMKLTIGILLLILSLLQIYLVIGKPAMKQGSEGSTLTSWLAGGAAGFATMTANSAWPVMTLFLLARRVSKFAFIGTLTWFFFFINVTKVPFSIGLGLFSVPLLLTALKLAPVVIVGNLLGIPLAKKLSQRQFDVSAITASIIGAAMLIIG